MITVEVVFSGRSYDTAARLPQQLQLQSNAQIGDALEAIASALGGPDKLPSSCLVAVAGEHLGTIEHHKPRALSDGDELVLIAPVAGG